jgi:hypothetical protein
MSPIEINSRRSRLRKVPRIALIFIGMLAACAPAAESLVDTPTPVPTVENLETAKPVNPESPTNSEISPEPNPSIDLNLDKYVYVPMLPRDAIRPVYDPDFVQAIDSPLHPDELVMGVAINGEAKAYPVTVLRFREMVNDELGGGPILVTW